MGYTQIKTIVVVNLAKQKVKLISKKKSNSIAETLIESIKLISLDKIIGGSRIQYNAEKSILLLPNFEIENGSYFSTKIETCDN